MGKKGNQQGENLFKIWMIQTKQREACSACVADRDCRRLHFEPKYNSASTSDFPNDYEIEIN